VLPVLLADAESTVLMQMRDYERILQPQQRLEELAKPLLAKGLKVQTLVTRGDPANEIVNIAKQKVVDLIVIATHGNTGWRRLAFGSVAEKVVRTACCPVLSIRSAVQGASADGNLHRSRALAETGEWHGFHAFIRADRTGKDAGRGRQQRVCRKSFALGPEP
jgi:hypothetical protein